MASDQRLTKQDRLRSRKDFAEVFAARCSRSDGLLTIYVGGNGGDSCRVGIQVSRRVGNAVRRNYLRRRIREAFRASKSRLLPGLDIICIVKPQAGRDCAGLAESFFALIAAATEKHRRKEAGSRPQPGPGAAER